MVDNWQPEIQINVSKPLPCQMELPSVLGGGNIS